MKVLLRRYDGKHYVWKDVKWNHGHYYLLDDSDYFDETQILAVKEDERLGYVQCKHCGMLIENNPESIEAHYAATEVLKDCMKCDKLTTMGDKYNLVKKIKANDDGTYCVEESYCTKLGCRMHYYTNNINSAEAKRNCKYALCRRSGVTEIQDTFIKYPDLFEKQITVDMLTSKKFEYKGYSNGYQVYDLKMRNTLKAMVNELGIVEYFIVYIRGWSHNFFYSDKYKKLFFYNYNKYDDNTYNYITDSKCAKIVEKLSKLYEEANVNE